MKVTKLLPAFGALVSLAVGFGICVLRENARMDSFCGDLIQGTRAGNSFSLLKLHESVLDSIRSGDVAKAEKLLVGIARGEAEFVFACEKDPGCTRWSGFEGSQPVDNELVHRAMAEK